MARRTPRDSRDDDYDDDVRPRRARRRQAERRKATIVIISIVAGVVGLLICIVALIAFFVMQGGASAVSPVDEATFARIRTGMSRNEVEQILGKGGQLITINEMPPQTNERDHERLINALRNMGMLTFTRWRNGPGQIVVGFVPRGGQDLVAFRGWFFKQGGTSKSITELNSPFGPVGR